MLPITFLWKGKDKLNAKHYLKTYHRVVFGYLQLHTLYKQEILIIQNLHKLKLNKLQPYINLYLCWFGLN